MCAVGRDYAYAIRELLDPDEQLFGNRIIAASDSGNTDLSKRLMQVWWRRMVIRRAWPAHCS